MAAALCIRDYNPLHQRLQPHASPCECVVTERQVTDDTDGGHAAFASILWSPPAAIGGGGSFDDLLRQVRHVHA